MIRHSIRQCYGRHKNECKAAGLCAVIVCSAAVLCAVGFRKNEKVLSVPDTETIAAAESEHVTLGGKKTGVKGSEIKRQLSSLKETDRYAVVVATSELLLERVTTESAYLVYPLDAKKLPEYVTASDGNRYMLFGVNYGCVLQDIALYSPGGSDIRYTIAGLMEESEYAQRNNYSDGTTKTVITRNRYHPYVPGESLSIPDREIFQKAYIYDKDEKEIGCFYYADSAENAGGEP